MGCTGYGGCSGYMGCTGYGGCYGGCSGYMGCTGYGGCTGVVGCYGGAGYYGGTGGVIVAPKTMPQGETVPAPQAKKDQVRLPAPATIVVTLPVKPTPSCRSTALSASRLPVNGVW